MVASVRVLVVKPVVAVRPMVDSRLSSWKPTITRFGMELFRSVASSSMRTVPVATSVRAVRTALVSTVFPE